MDIYIIPPVNHLGLMHEGGRYFCLAQLYRKHEHYRDFFKQRVSEGKWVTLDSGIGDHNPVTQKDLYEVTIDLMPSEVIPLDTLYNARNTFDNVVSFINQLKADGHQEKIRILAVPQGNTFDQWMQCYHNLLLLPEVNTIGMSKLSIPWVISHSEGDKNIARDRNVMFDYLTNTRALRKSLHFLGAGEPWEFKHYINSPFVRSTDSCFTVWSGMNMVSFRSEYKRIPTPRDYFDRTITEEQMLVVRDNIINFRHLISLV